MSGALVYFSVCKCQKFNRGLPTTGLQNLFSVNDHECLNYVFFPTTEEALFFCQEILGVLRVIQVPFSAPAPPQ